MLAVYGTCVSAEAHENTPPRGSQAVNLITVASPLSQYVVKGVLAGAVSGTITKRQERKLIPSSLPHRS